MYLGHSTNPWREGLPRHDFQVDVIGVSKPHRLPVMIAGARTPTDVHCRLATAHAEITNLGVKRLALFGSVQRNTARPDSDVDVLVEFLPAKKDPTATTMSSPY